MRLCAILAMLAALSGCAGLPRAFNVGVPIAVACTEPVPDRPYMPTDGLVPGTDPDKFVKHAQAEIEIRDGYEDRLLSALQACRKPIN
jgi:hypothetical protein